MFGLFKKKPPVLAFKNLRAFGKLPGFADFVRYRSADPEAAKLDAWLTEGLASLRKEGMQAILEEPWRLSLCWQVNKTFKIVMVTNSQDKSGRHYPFVLIAQVDNPWLYDYIPSLPLLFDALFTLAESLKCPTLDKQQMIVDKIDEFEKYSLLLSKRVLLEERITALKSLKQSQAWGAWCALHQDLNPSAWKSTKIMEMNSKKIEEYPMGSSHPISEVTYWLQLREDLEGASCSAVSYYWLCASSIKKIVIEQGGQALPDFRSLFTPYPHRQLHHEGIPGLIYDPDLSLLDAGNYWSRAK